MPGEDIYSWSTTAAENGSADTGINWVEGQARASVNNSSRAEMAAHAKFRNLLTGTITTTGSANAQAFVSGVGYTVIPTGLRVLLHLGFTNTGAITLNMDAIGAVAVKDTLGNELLAGELPEDGFAEFCYDGTNWILLNAPSITFTSLTDPDGGGPGGGGGIGTTFAVRRGYIDGFTLSYVSATEITIGPGQASDDTNARTIDLTTALTKTAGVWEVGTNKGGLDTGAIAASTWYHVFLIYRSDTNGKDILLSTSLDTPTLPTGYDFKRRIGSCRTNATSQFLAFTQFGTQFIWNVPVLDVEVTDLTNTRVLFPLTVPSGVLVYANIYGNCYSATPASVWIGPPVVDDITPSPYVSPGPVCFTGPGSLQNSVISYTLSAMATDLSGRIAARSSIGGTTLRIFTQGWIDTRGKDI